jgi:hypothetical protein
MNPHFASLVMGLAVQAHAALDGKLPEEAAGANARDLARALIDTLGMLEQKTAGHLDADEQRLMNELLASLRIRFVKESK